MDTVYPMPMQRSTPRPVSVCWPFVPSRCAYWPNCGACCVPVAGCWWRAMKFTVNYASFTPLPRIENRFRSQSISALTPSGSTNIGSVCPKSMLVMIGRSLSPFSSTTTCSSTWSYSANFPGRFARRVGQRGCLRAVARHPTLRRCAIVGTARR